MAIWLQMNEKDNPPPSTRLGEVESRTGAERRALPLPPTAPAPRAHLTARAHTALPEIVPAHRPTSAKKNKGKGKAPAPKTDDDDDALIAAALAENYADHVKKEKDTPAVATSAKAEPTAPLSASGPLRRSPRMPTPPAPLNARLAMLPSILPSVDILKAEPSAFLTMTFKYDDPLLDLSDHFNSAYLMFEAAGSNAFKQAEEVHFNLVSTRFIAGTAADLPPVAHFTLPHSYYRAMMLAPPNPIGLPAQSGIVQIQIVLTETDFTIEKKSGYVHSSEDSALHGFARYTPGWKASYNEKDYIIAEQLVPEITEGYIKHLRSRAALDEEGQGTNSHNLTMAPADEHAHDNDFATRDHLHKLAKKLDVGNGIFVWIALSKRTCAHFNICTNATCYHALGPDTKCPHDSKGKAAGGNQRGPKGAAAVKRQAAFAKRQAASKAARWFTIPPQGTPPPAPSGAGSSNQHAAAPPNPAPAGTPPPWNERPLPPGFAPQA